MFIQCTCEFVSERNKAEGNAEYVRSSAAALRAGRGCTTLEIITNLFETVYWNSEFEDHFKLL